MQVKTHTDQELAEREKLHLKVFFSFFFVVWHLPGFRQQLNEMLEQRQMELVRSVEPHLRSGGNTLRPLSRKVSLSNTNFGQEQASHRASSGRTFNSHISVAAADNIFQNRTKEIFLQMFHQARKYWKKKKRSWKVYLKVAEQVLEGGGVGDDGGLVAAVHRPHQREGEMEDVAVEQRALLLQQHRQQLHEETSFSLVIF